MKNNITLYAYLVLLSGFAICQASLLKTAPLFTRRAASALVGVRAFQGNRFAPVVSLIGQRSMTTQTASTDLLVLAKTHDGQSNGRDKTCSSNYKRVAGVFGGAALAATGGMIYYYNQNTTLRKELLYSKNEFENFKYTDYCLYANYSAINLDKRNRQVSALSKQKVDTSSSRDKHEKYLDSLKSAAKLALFDADFVAYSTERVLVNKNCNAHDRNSVAIIVPQVQEAYNNAKKIFTEEDFHEPRGEILRSCLENIEIFLSKHQKS